MKKVLAILLALFMALTLTACGKKDPEPVDPTPQLDPDPEWQWVGEVHPEVTGDLMIYSTMADLEFSIFYEGFGHKYPNVKMEYVNAGAGELKSRIEAESANPQCDVMLGGLVYSDAINYANLFEPYVSVNNSKMSEDAQNQTGVLTWITDQVVNLVVNTKVCEELGVEVKGYNDLLNPKLQGMINVAVPTTSSGWNNLCSMLTVMGNGDASSDAAWEYVDKLMANLGGKLQSSSSKVFKEVFAGEKAVGVSYEFPCITAEVEGVDPVKVVYFEEGTIHSLFADAIIKNAPHMELAKLFIDWTISDECQGKLATSLQRQGNANIKNNPALKPYSEMKLFKLDNEYLAKNQPQILEHWNQLWTKYESGN